jgi:hypothetical protein
LLNLREGRSVPVLYETRFFIAWPEHLGGGSSYLDLAGSMLLHPAIGS